jgi:dihydroneopterin aldolase
VDRILIEGLRCSATIGVTAAERRRRQRLLLDLALLKSLAQAGKRDNVSLTVDYAGATALAKRCVEDRPYRVVEAVAEQVAAALLKAFPVEAVRVRVRKFSVPQAESVGVEVTRRRRGGRGTKKL